MVLCQTTSHLGKIRTQIAKSESNHANHLAATTTTEWTNFIFRSGKKQDWNSVPPRPTVSHIENLYGIPPRRQPNSFTIHLN